MEINHLRASRTISPEWSRSGVTIGTASGEERVATAVTAGATACWLDGITSGERREVKRRLRIGVVVFGVNQVPEVGNARGRTIGSSASAILILLAETCGRSAKR